MSTIDQFESVFRAAVTSNYEPRSFPLRQILLISNFEDDQLEADYLAALERFFEGSAQSPKLTAIPPEQSLKIPRMLEAIEQHEPDLIVVYRNLHDQVEGYDYTLGDHIEVLTQATHVPILLLPHPDSWPVVRIQAPQRALVLTDMLDQHPQLIDAALTLLSPAGQLTLAHVEDDATFERYLGYISKIPEIDTELARTLIHAQILGEAERFMELTSASIAQQKDAPHVHSEVKMGHRLKSYLELVDSHHIELIVMQTKDEDQVAMHGLSYPLAVELKHTPLLML